MNNQHARLRWDCRRGMLELDLLLLPFFEKQFPNLPEHEQKLFTRLLACTDQDLYDWLVKKESPNDPELITIIEQIIHAAAHA
jgi:antitoxin CptB